MSRLINKEYKTRVVGKIEFIIKYHSMLQNFLKTFQWNAILNSTIINENHSNWTHTQNFTKTRSQLKAAMKEMKYHRHCEIFKTNTKKENSEIDQKMDITCFAYVAEKYETMPFYRKIGVKIK